MAHTIIHTICLTLYLFTTRGPWTATPVLIKVEERGENKQAFLHAKHFKPHAIYGKRRSLFQQLSKQTQKIPFSLDTP